MVNKILTYLFLNKTSELVVNAWEKLNEAYRELD